MAKVSRNFRLEPEVLEDLGRLSEDWEVSQARVLELLVREAVAEEKTLKMEIVSGQSPLPGSRSGADRERASS